jgi:hypothetical protein
MKQELSRYGSKSYLNKDCKGKYVNHERLHKHVPIFFLINWSGNLQLNSKGFEKVKRNVVCVKYCRILRCKLMSK